MASSPKHTPRQNRELAEEIETVAEAEERFFAECGAEVAALKQLNAKLEARISAYMREVFELREAVAELAKQLSNERRARRRAVCQICTSRL